MDPRLDDLIKAILALENPQEARAFFRDLCTPTELSALADRWLVAQLLDQGVAYRSIYERTGVSTATVTRVARSLTHGESGYRALLDRSQPHKKADHA
jgi:TrpR-related protein YerC/YecD